jgi:hypothetical protein
VTRGYSPFQHNKELGLSNMQNTLYS